MTRSALLRHLGLAVLLSVSAAQAGASPADWTEDREQPAAGAPTTPQERPLRFAQGNCSAAAAQAAAQTGGQVLSVSSRNEGGQTVCVVTVLVPGQDGGRPRRTTITVPG